MARATIVMGALVGIAAGCAHSAATQGSATPAPTAPVTTSASATPTPAATPSVSATAAPRPDPPASAEARLRAAFPDGVPPLDPAVQLGHAMDVEVLLGAAAYLRRRLGGAVVMLDGGPLDAAAVRARSSAVAAAMLAADVVPGTELAVSVFP
jgi:hypothetical protein